MNDPLVHIALADTKRYGWWTTLCGRTRRGRNVARWFWVAAFGTRFVTCPRCNARYHGK
jgi:hypothetical protein